jgi:hypothetical protein
MATTDGEVQVHGATAVKTADDDIDMMWYRMYMNPDQLVWAENSGDSLVEDATADVSSTTSLVVERQSQGPTTPPNKG